MTLEPRTPKPGFAVRAVRLAARHCCRVEAKPRFFNLLAFALAVLAALASAWVADRVYERIPHLEDEMANLWQAEVMADGQAYQPSPPMPRSFMVPFVVDYEGHRFGKYPPGWPAMLSLGARAGAPWLVNPILAGLTAWLVYRLGSRIAGRGIGLLAELLTATSPMFLMLSGSLMGHSLGLFLTAAFWLAWLDLFPPGGGQRDSIAPRWLPVSVAGLSLGLLALTRPLTAVGVGLPAVIHGLVLLVRGDRAARRRVLGVGGLALAVAAILPLWQWALTGNPWLNPYTLWWPYDTIGFGPGVGHTATGHNLYWAYINTRFSLRAGQHDLFGWPYLSWLFLPFGLIALRRSRDGWLLFSLFPSLVFVYIFYWIGSWLLGPRYYYEALPGLAITSAVGVAWLGGWLGSRVGRWASLRRVATGTLLLVLMALNLLYYVPIRVGGLQGLYGISRKAMQPLEAADLGRALVIVHPVHSWTEYGSLLTLEPPFADSDLLLAYSRGAEADARLARHFADWPVYHYYADQPGTFYPRPR
jgi:hypothetical protein